MSTLGTILEEPPLSIEPPFLNPQQVAEAEGGGRSNDGTKVILQQTRNSTKMERGSCETEIRNEAGRGENHQSSELL